MEGRLRTVLRRVNDFVALLYEIERSLISGSVVSADTFMS